MNTLAYTRTGGGEPLVLLHGLGSFRQAWDPVVPALAEIADVVAVDLSGFGESPPLPDGVEPSPAALALAVAALLDKLGLDTPHVAGNSLGGWVALELAAVRPVASLTLLSPAGLWRGGEPAVQPGEPASLTVAGAARRPPDRRSPRHPTRPRGRAGTGHRPASSHDARAGAGRRPGPR